MESQTNVSCIHVLFLQITKFDQTIVRKDTTNTYVKHYGNRYFTGILLQILFAKYIYTSMLRWWHLQNRNKKATIPSYNGITFFLAEYLSLFEYG